MKSFIKRIGVAITCAAVACSALLIPVQAATLRGISFNVTGADAANYLVENGGTVKENFIFTDGNSKVTWRIPLEKSATVATLVVDVAANYHLELSADGTDWVEWAKAPGGAGVGEMGTGNRTEEVADVSEYIPNGMVYFRMGDQTTGNGWGGNLWTVKLKYFKYEKEVILPLEYTDLVKKNDAFKNILGDGNFNFVPGTKLEKRVFVNGVGGGQLADSGRMRFMDHTNTVTYRVPIDASRQFFLNMVLAANYMIRISLDNEFFYPLDAAEGGKNKDEFGPENKGMHSYNSKTDIPKALSAGGQTLTPETQYLYVRIGDQSTGSGWGGQLFYFGVHYGKTNGVYNPFITKGVKSTLVRYKRPQKVMSYGVVTSKKLIETTDEPIIDDGAWDVPVEEPIPEEPDVVEDIPVDETVIDPAVVETENPVDEQTDAAPQQQSGNSLVWYIVIGAIALLLIGGAVTQFILMEKKRIAGLEISE